MYVPKPFLIEDRSAQHDLIDANPLGIMIRVEEDQPRLAHIPFVLDREVGTLGRLRCHVARANPLWETIEADARVTIAFQGAESYISPDWYETRTLVPTWNYEAVEAQGQARIMSAEDTYALIVDLSAQEEEKLRPKSPWKIEKVPEKQAQALLRAIVGIEIDLTELTGKRKMSQNRSAEDRAGVASALRLLGGDASEAVADLINPS